MKQLSELTDEEFAVLSAVVNASDPTEEGAANSMINTLLNHSEPLTVTELLDLRQAVSVDQERRGDSMHQTQLTEKQRIIQKLLE